MGITGIPITTAPPNNACYKNGKSPCIYGSCSISSLFPTGYFCICPPGITGKRKKVYFSIYFYGVLIYKGQNCNIKSSNSVSNFTFGSYFGRGLVDNQLIQHLKTSVDEELQRHAILYSSQK